MASRRWFFLLSVLLVLLAVVGCGGAPATPTKPPVTIPPVVMTVIVTATPPPASPTSTAPTAAPTSVITATVALTTPVASKPTSVAVKAATRTPTKSAVTKAPTPLPQKFAAPRLLEPIFDVDQGKKDERHFPGDALVFKWTSVGALGTDECYAINVSMTPGQGDAFLTACGDQSQQGYQVVNPSFPGSSFTLYQPKGPGPNYSALLPVPNADTWVSWTVTAVKDLGKGNGPQDAGGTRHNTAALGPASARAQFLLKGQ